MLKIRDLPALARSISRQVSAFAPEKIESSGPWKPEDSLLQGTHNLAIPLELSATFWLSSIGVKVFGIAKMITINIDRKIEVKLGKWFPVY